MDFVTTSCTDTFFSEINNIYIYIESQIHKSCWIISYSSILYKMIHNMHPSILMQIVECLSASERVCVAACCKSLQDQIMSTSSIDIKKPVLWERLKAASWELMMHGYGIRANNDACKTMGEPVAYGIHHHNRRIVFYCIKTIVLPERRVSYEEFEVPANITEFGIEFDKLIDSSARIYRGSRCSRFSSAIPRNKKAESRFSKCVDASFFANSKRRIIDDNDDIILTFFTENAWN